MSELINNNQTRKEELKTIIKKLHQGVPFEEVKREFQEKFGTVSTVEIAQMEQALIAEGMPAEEIQKLCDVHAEVFKGSIEEIHRPTKDWDNTPGHPIHTFKLENRAMEKVTADVESKLDDFVQDNSQEKLYEMLEDLNLLWDIDKHYSRKENLLFPYIERYGVTGPAKVMWANDDEIRELIKKSIRSLKAGNADRQAVAADVKSAIEKIRSMIFKEEGILFPTSTRFLTDEEWYKIAEESDEIGYCLIAPSTQWVPESVKAGLDSDEDKAGKGYIKFETGILSVKEISAIFSHLPIDITFVDKDDTVKYFSHSAERIFVRTKAIIGRNVTNCHPPNSVHVVEKIVEDFKSGKKDTEDFWIPLGDMFVLIRYFAVRDENGEYMGTMEITQNIKPLQALTGQKRLLED